MVLQVNKTVAVLAAMLAAVVLAADMVLPEAMQVISQSTAVF